MALQGMHLKTKRWGVWGGGQGHKVTKVQVTVQETKKETKKIKKQAPNHSRAWVHRLNKAVRFKLTLVESSKTSLRKRALQICRFG